MKKICLISYYFRPYKGVGAFRLSYWYDRLKDEDVEVTVFTATSDESDGSSSIVRLPERAKELFGIKDKSFLWGVDCRKYIKEYLYENQDAVVVISGGPFLHILPIISLRNKFKNSRWILDYRDPLANNPSNRSRTFTGNIKYSVKCVYEKYINSYADAIVTVNEVCKGMVLASNVYVIDNGFDERSFSTHLKKNINNTIVYAGKTNYFRSIEPLLDAVCTLPENYTFDYIGPNELPKTSDRIVSHGFCNYEQTAELLKQSSIGVILATGESFESTTKVFDYFAARLKILIVTRGEPKTGTLYEITKDNPNVEWAKDTPDDIRAAILKLERPYKSWDYQMYSRAYGYNLLRNLINTLS